MTDATQETALLIVEIKLFSYCGNSIQYLYIVKSTQLRFFKNYRRWVDPCTVSTYNDTYYIEYVYFTYKHAHIL